MSSDHSDETLTAFIEAKERELMKTESDLKQLKDEELRLQRLKQQLQSIKVSLAVILKQKENRLQCCRGGLTQMQKNIFDQIYPIVADIHHQELLVQELNHQLKLKQISKDVGYICSKICQESCLQLEKPSDTLWCWYKEMKEYDKKYTTDNSFNIYDDEIPDSHFFYSSYKELDGKVQLAFSTRYKNRCLYVNISQDRYLPSEESCLPFNVFTDFTIVGLVVNINKLLLNGGTAHQLVEEFIWPALGDLG